MENTLINEFEYLANKNATSENVGDRCMASMLFSIIGAYYSNKLLELTNHVSEFSIKTLNEMNNAKSSLN
jgi:hypothetical protein